MSKNSAVRITAAKASAPLPKPLGTFATAPEQPGPIYPKQMRRDQQISEGPHVRIVSPKASASR
jgi:hypothetical protein